MCIGIAAIKKFPSKEFLERSAEQNTHGAGVAWLEDGQVHWKKGIQKLEEVYEYEAKGPPWLIHFRIATVGGMNPYLCHPFPVTKSCSLDLEGKTDQVLIHNGHWALWRDTCIRSLERGDAVPAGPWSDTRAMAWLSSLYGTGLLELINEKVAVMKSNGEVDFFGDGWVNFDEGNIFATYNPFTRGKTMYSRGETSPQYCLGKTYEFE